MKISKIASYLLSIMLVILLGIGVSGCMSEKEEILSYLEEKYGEKFEVVRYWSESDGTSHLSHKMMVHPTDKPELLFKTGKFWDPIKRKVVFWDSYIKIRWSLDYTKQHQSDFTSLDDKEMDVQFLMNVSGNPEAKYLNMRMEDYLLTKQGEEAKPSGIIAIIVNCDKEPDKIKEAEFIYKVYKKVQNLGLHSFTINVTFIKSGSFEEARELLKLMQGDAYIDVEKVGRENWYYRVNVFDSHNINSPVDLIPYFSSGE